MAKQKLPKYTLTKPDNKKGWELKEDKTKEVIHTYQKKENATRKGGLADQLGPDGGSVKIQTKKGKFQEERTFPRSKDPKESKG